MRDKVKEILQRIVKKDNETIGENHIFKKWLEIWLEGQTSNEFQKENREKNGRKLSNKYYNICVKTMIIKIHNCH